MKSILITGANRGLGYALLEAFHQIGYRTFPLVREEAAGETLKQEFQNCTPIVADITEETVGEKVQVTLEAIGQLDVLINNAGSGSTGKTIDLATSEQLQKEFNVHCLGAFRVTKAALPFLKQANAPIVLNISSRRGSMAKNASGEYWGSGSSYSYRIGKAAQNMLTLCLREDLHPHGITVAAIHPGRLKTALASADAHMNTADSAQKIRDLIESQTLDSEKFTCLETGILPW